jgi:Tat protein translocase TatB subunit
MDILGVGFSELIFILIIAMMIFGPRRLPEIAAKAGKIVRDLRNMSQGLLTEWQREITVAGRLDELEKARQELRKTQQEFRQAKKTVALETSEAQKTISSSHSTPRSIGQESASSEQQVPDKPTGPDSDQPQENITSATLSKEKDAIVTATPSESAPTPSVKRKPEKTEANVNPGISTETSDTTPSGPDASPSVLSSKPKEALNG